MTRREIVWKWKEKSEQIQKFFVFFFLLLQANLESIETYRQLNGSADVIDAMNGTNKLLYKRAANDPGESFYKYATEHLILCKYCPFLSFRKCFNPQCFGFFVLFGSHFEDSVIGSFTENSSIEYSISSSASDGNAITGAPVSYQDNSDISNSFLANNIDFGEFMDSTADIIPNKLKHALCGKLTIK